MEFSSETEASIEFQKCFYKQMFYDLFKQINPNSLDTRFYGFQIKLFQSYNLELQNQNFLEVFSFSDLDFEEKSQLLESIFFHLVRKLKTFPIQYWGEEMKLKDKLQQSDFELVENGLLGARPRAIDRFSNEFLTAAYKRFCQSEYLDFFFFIIRENLACLEMKEHKDLIASSLRELLQHYPVKFDEVKIDSDSITEIIDLRHIDNHSYITDLYIKMLGDDVGSENELARTLLQDWGIEDGLSSIFVSIRRILQEDLTINVAKEIKSYFDCYTGTNKNCFISELKHSKQSIHVYMPVLLPGSENWKIPKDFEIMFESVYTFISQESNIPYQIVDSLLDSKCKYAISHVMIWETNTFNADYNYAISLAHEKWSKFLDLLHLHEKMLLPYKSNFNSSFASRTILGETHKKWILPSISSKYRPMLDDDDFKNKVTYFNNVEIPLTKSESDLGERLSVSYNLYRKSLELLISDPTYAFGSLWLCLEVISRCFEPKEVGKRLAFIPAMLSDEIYNKQYFEKISIADAKEIYNKRKQMFEIIIKELGELRNKYIFHKTDPRQFQFWRLDKHIELLQFIVLRIQIVLANTIKKSPELNKIEEVKRLKENNMFLTPNVRRSE
ncbi:MULTISPECIES: hypothetical protein [unclassified Paenibacillus]|uniref:hypothetical protein n=1 Tax=unclassified Paenibacillus TaxID=185978 RepID=UPI00383919C4